ncbi:MAG: hypothetical protein QS721_06070 [Candidatus Endonucleobacter sp. (ex Gigantidas childressi)]|nr:hypothetical protein [Candidatus Endonucleobacter sp. (ex Gigantidas childressi)]
MNLDSENITTVQIPVQQNAGKAFVELLQPFIYQGTGESKVSHLKWLSGNEVGVNLSLSGTQLEINLDSYDFVAVGDAEQLCYQYRINTHDGNYSQNTITINIAIDENYNPAISSAILATDKPCDDSEFSETTDVSEDQELISEELLKDDFSGVDTVQSKDDGEFKDATRENYFELDDLGSTADMADIDLVANKADSSDILTADKPLGDEAELNEATDVSEDQELISEELLKEDFSGIDTVQGKDDGEFKEAAEKSCFELDDLGSTADMADIDLVANKADSSDILTADMTFGDETELNEATDVSEDQELISEELLKEDFSGVDTVQSKDDGEFKDAMGESYFELDDLGSTAERADIDLVANKADSSDILTADMTFGDETGLNEATGVSEDQELISEELLKEDFSGVDTIQSKDDGEFKDAMGESYFELDDLGSTAERADIDLAVHKADSSNMLTTDKPFGDEAEFNETTGVSEDQEFISEELLKDDFSGVDTVQSKDDGEFKNATRESYFELDDLGSTAERADIDLAANKADPSNILTANKPFGDEAEFNETTDVSEDQQLISEELLKDDFSGADTVQSKDDGEFKDATRENYFELDDLGSTAERADIDLTVNKDDPSNILTADKLFDAEELNETTGVSEDQELVLEDPLNESFSDVDAVPGKHDGEFKDATEKSSFELDDLGSTADRSGIDLVVNKADSSDILTTDKPFGDETELNETTYVNKDQELVSEDPLNEGLSDVDTVQSKDDGEFKDTTEKSYFELDDLGSTADSADIDLVVNKTYPAIDSGIELENENSNDVYKGENDYEPEQIHDEEAGDGAELDYVSREDALAGLVGSLPDSMDTEDALTGLVKSLPDEVDKDHHEPSDTTDDFEHMVARLPSDNEAEVSSDDFLKGELEQTEEVNSLLFQEMMVDFGEAYIFGPDDFDPMNRGLTTIRLEGMPDMGSLLYNKEPISAGQEVSRQDLLAGRLRFESGGNQSASGDVHFLYSVYYEK